MFRFLALACLASLTSGCLLTLAAGIPVTPEVPTQPAGSTDTANAGEPGRSGGGDSAGLSLSQRLLGAWRYETGDGNALVLTFLANGVVTGHPANAAPSAALLMTGQYELAGDVLTFAFPATGPVSGRLSFSADGRTMIMGNAALRRHDADKE